jgi:hypothetical protein
MVEGPFLIRNFPISIYWFLYTLYPHAWSNPGLISIQFEVPSFFINEFLMLASFNDLAMLYYKDLIRLAYGT